MHRSGAVNLNGTEMAVNLRELFAILDEGSPSPMIIVESPEHLWAAAESRYQDL